MKKNVKYLAALVALALVFAMFAGCAKETAKDDADTGVAIETSVDESADEDTLAGEITLAAAASLQNAFDADLIPMFAQLHPNVTVTATYDSSGTLQKQIEEGLDAQIFFSAATSNMDKLVEGGFIDESTVTNLIANEVVLITGANTDTKVTGFDNITDAATIAIGDPESVPAGRYAKEILTNLGVWDAVSAKASLGTKVTEVLAQVAAESAEVGVVYKTDAMSKEGEVRVISVAPEGSLATPVIDPVGLRTDLGDKEETAQAFLDLLKTPEALAVFEKYGFLVISIG